MQKKSNLLILGASGFIGKNLINQLHKKFNIFAISRSDKYEKSFHKLPVKYHFLDIFSDNFEFELKNINPIYIINLISYVSADSKNIIPSVIFNDNFFSIVRLINVILKVRAFPKLLIHLGTSEEYGSLTGPFNEMHKERPNSLYSLSKLTATQYLQMVANELDFNSVILRPSNLFGQYQSQNKLIPTIVKSIKENKNFTISSLNKRREFYSINDLVFVIESIIQSTKKLKGEVLNIGYGESIEIKEIIELTSQYFNHVPKFTEDNTLIRSNESLDFKVSISKYFEIFKKKPFNKSFKQRFSDYLRNFKNNLP
jgi:UDP-glucose 4-epimerase